MRKMMVTFLVILMLALGGTSFAQEIDPCFNLSEADCALITESNAAMAELTSATFDFVVNVNVAGTTDGSDGSFILSGDGSFAGDLGGLSMTDLSTSNLSPEASLELLKTVLTSFSGELNLGIAAPEEGLPEGMLQFNLMLVDGVGYLNFESLSMLLGGPDALTAMGLPTGWGGLDLIDVLDQGSEMMGDLSELEGAMDDAVVEQAEMQAQAVDLASRYVTVERGADEDSVAVFTTVIDFGGLVADPAFLELIQSSVEAQGETLTEEEMNEAVGMLGAMGDALSISVVQRINTDTKYVESSNFSLTVDVGAAAAAAGEAGASGVLTVTGEFNASDFNSAPAIAAPADAPVATFMDLMMLMGAMNGGGF